VPRHVSYCESGGARPRMRRRTPEYIDFRCRSLSKDLFHPF
jgi:hypothetical protein